MSWDSLPRARLNCSRFLAMVSLLQRGDKCSKLPITSHAMRQNGRGASWLLPAGTKQSIVSSLSVEGMLERRNCMQSASQTPRELLQLLHPPRNPTTNWVHVNSLAACPNAAVLFGYISVCNSRILCFLAASHHIAFGLTDDLT